MVEIFLTSKFSEVSGRVLNIINGKKLGKKVLFITTASNLHEDKIFLEEDIKKFEEGGFNVLQFDIADKKAEELKKLVEEYDIIFVAGGNTFLLMQEIKKTGFDKIIYNLFKKNKVYIGSSAGSAIFGPTIEYIKIFDDPSVAKNLKNYLGLKIFDFLLLPHYDHEEFIKAYPFLKKEYKRFKFVRIKDNQFLYNNGKLFSLKIF